jgi:hypothetical protein
MGWATTEGRATDLISSTQPLDRQLTFGLVGEHRVAGTSGFSGLRRGGSSPACYQGFAQPGLVGPLRATVRAKIPSVARSAPSDITGKIPAVFQVSSISDQS